MSEPGSGTGVAFKVISAIRKGEVIWIDRRVVSGITPSLGVRKAEKA